MLHEFGEALRAAEKPNGPKDEVHVPAGLRNGGTAAPTDQALPRALKAFHLYYSPNHTSSELRARLKATNNIF